MRLSFCQSLQFFTSSWLQYRTSNYPSYERRAGCSRHQKLASPSITFIRSTVNQTHSLTDLRQLTVSDFGIVDWEALISTIPAMLALTFFGILHVPINVPALGLTTGEDNVDVDRELRAHGYSNMLSGFCGSIQVALVQIHST